MGNRLREPKFESKGLVKKLKDKGVKSLESASKKGVKDATDALAEIKNSGK